LTAVQPFDADIQTSDRQNVDTKNAPKLPTKM
jgi:hypothetical protein